MRNTFLVLGLLGQTESKIVYNEASEPIECACGAPSQTGVSFSWYSSIEVRGFPYGFSGDYERLESQFCSQIREEFTSCGFYKQKQINYDDGLIIVNGVKLYKNNWSDFDCEATCGLGAKPPFNSGWFALIALLVVLIIPVCIWRGCLKLCSKCRPATPEESNYGPGRSTLLANDSP